MQEKHQKGFTLAEVLITLGIIGVVAAMTLPAITAKTEKQQTLAKLKKAYSVLSQGIKQSELDNGEISTWPVGAEITDVNVYFEKYWKPYYKNPKICSSAVSCGYDSLLAWKNLNGDKTGWTVETSESRVLFMLADGTLIFSPRNSWTEDGSESYVNLFYVDLNGSKNPNVLGKDVFLFTLADNKMLRPYCYNKEYKDLKCNKNSGGNYNCCTAKIIADGWQIKDDYPW